MEARPLTRTEQVIRDLHSALDAANEVTLSWQQPDQVKLAVEAATVLRAKLDAFISTAAALAERTAVAKQHGYRTTAQMVADRTGADPRQVRADVRLGEWLDDLDELARAFATGALPRTHLDLIRRSVDSARSHQALIRDQHLFIEWAADYDFVDYARICRYWVTANDPDGQEPKDQIRKNNFRATKNADGTVKLAGHLDPLTGSAFLTAFEHEAQKLFRQAQDTGDTLAPDLRFEHQAMARQRRVTALMNLITRGHERADGSHPVPLVAVVASQSVVEATIERLHEPSAEPLPLSFDDIDARCELLDGTPLHPTYLLATLGLATFRRQILTAKGRTIDVSVNARCFTPWQQHALRVQARGRCRSGCDAPFAWLQADHVEPHSRGGPTRMDNGDMKCGPDNQAKGAEPPDKRRPAA